MYTKHYAEKSPVEGPAYKSLKEPTSIPLQLANIIGQRNVAQVSAGLFCHTYLLYLL